MYAAKEYTSSSSIWTRIVRAIGPRGLLTWLLLLITLAVMVGGLVEVVNGLEFAYSFAVITLGMTLGWLLGVTPVHPTLGWSFGLVVGVEFLLIRVGRLGKDVTNIVQSFFTVAGQILAWVWDLLRYLASYSFKEGEFGRELVRAVDWAAIPEAFGTVWTGMGTLLSRAYAWLSAILSEGAIPDPVGAALVWGAVLWVCALWAGWMISRKQRPLLAILPSGFVLSFVLAYTWSSPGVLLPMLGLVLILMALIHHRARETRWNITGIDFSRDLWSELAMIATGISLGLVLLAAVLPTFSYDKLAEWIEEITGPDEEETQIEQVAESLGLEQQPKPQPVRPVQLASSTDLPRRHLIGSGPELSRIVAFVIETGELPPLAGELLETDFIVPRHYWRSVTYDRYFGRGWATSGSDQIEYSAGEALLNPEVITNTRVLRQSVRVVGQLGGLVHVDGDLVSMDQDYKVAWRTSADVFAVTAEERVYRADSLLPVFTVEQLQAASIEYPQAILDRYLQLPEDVPERVLALARDLTATEPTPFDRAAAIESYLREFPYTLDVPRPSVQDDIADYFLFELKEGYCDYYATSMVVLARAAGLPSRLAVGYASGRYDYGNARYVITEADAHAWVEVYFPDYGWVNFEPTGGRPPISRPSEQEPVIWPDGAPLAPLTAATPPDADSPAMHIVFGQWIMIVVGAGVLVVVGASGLDSALLLMMRRSPEAMATALYDRLRREAHRLDVTRRTGDTPYELGAAFVKRMLDIATSRNDGDLLPPAEDEIPVLVDLYVKAWYSPREITQDERKAAVWAWWKLQWRLGLARLWRKRRTERPEMPDEGKPVVVTKVPPPRMPL